MDSVCYFARFTDTMRLLVDQLQHMFACAVEGAPFLHTQGFSKSGHLIETLANERRL